jgi:plasmid stabilization system protein ParE
MKVRILPAAEAEIEEAAEWYEAARRGLAAEFVREVDAGLQRVAESPNAWHPLSQRLRRYRLHRFPYGIIYQVRKNEILVIAVAHLHRRPEYWRNRLKGS